MNRRQFFKTLAATVAAGTAAVVTPIVAKEEEPHKTYVINSEYLKPAHYVDIKNAVVYDEWGDVLLTNRKEKQRWLAWRCVQLKDGRWAWGAV